MPDLINVSRTQRQAAISDLIARGLVTSQSRLKALLAEHGMIVTQPTLSKDLAEIGAIRVRSPHGGLVYTLPEHAGTGSASLDRMCASMLLSADASANLVVVHTPPGGAQYFAMGIDKAGWDTILGCVAGDDTVIIVTRDHWASQRVLAQLLGYRTSTRGES